MVGQVNPEPVEAVCDCRAGRTACRVVGSEHEVIDEGAASALGRGPPARRFPRRSRNNCTWCSRYHPAGLSVVIITIPTVAVAGITLRAEFDGEAGE